MLTRRTVLGAAIAASIGVPAKAAQLHSIKVLETPDVPLVRPDWPVPREPHQLFYIQRSTNPNVVVYTARFDKSGKLHPRKPARVYWRRYNTTGERMELRPFERRFAFGMKVQTSGAPGEWVVNAKAAPMFPMRVRQRAAFEAEVTSTLGGRLVTPVYAFITVDEAGILPRVTQVSLHGIDVKSGRAISEIFGVEGGTFQE